MRDPIPDFPLPLQRDEPEPLIPLNRVLHKLYARAAIARGTLGMGA
ncbi:MAG: DUF4058 family protein [Anaerolineales bacterium]|nr:DUF4058 family protein [Anaerolineales bacterium]